MRHDDEIAKAVKAAVEEERKACAVVADTCKGFTHSGPAAIAIAAAIRARGD